MLDFVRARSSEQKGLRMEEIKRAADQQFMEKPYHEITLTTIAEKLSWSRANLYKYVTTKEEIFLELSADKWNAYFAALRAAFPAECAYSAEVFAEVWTGILNAHMDYLRYSSILIAIIETNVTVERLAIFKKSYHDQADEISERFASILHITPEEAYEIFLAVHYHAVGMSGYCVVNPLVKQALDLAGVKLQKIDFRKVMKTFIGMNLSYYMKDKS